MRAVLQRVVNSKVTVDSIEIASIGKGILLLLGIGGEDTEEKCEKLVEKIIKMRIFADEEGKTNLSIRDIKGQILIVSQFTLYAETKKGNRPSFSETADPIKAEKLYNYFIKYCQGKFEKVSQGSFGSNMQVSLTNNGPFTIILDV